MGPCQLPAPLSVRALLRTQFSALRRRCPDVPARSPRACAATAHRLQLGWVEVQSQVFGVMEVSNLAGDHLEVREQDRGRQLEVENPRFTRPAGAPDAI